MIPDQVGKRLEELDAEMSGPFWGAQVSYVGTVLPKLQRIKTESGAKAIIASCDRPVVFYEADETVEMHYLAQKLIRNVAYVEAPRHSPVLQQDEVPRFLVMYEDKDGVLHLSESDNLRRL